MGPWLQRPLRLRLELQRKRRLNFTHPDLAKSAWRETDTDASLCTRSFLRILDLMHSDQVPLRLSALQPRNRRCRIIRILCQSVA